MDDNVVKLDTPPPPAGEPEPEDAASLSAIAQAMARINARPLAEPETCGNCDYYSPQAGSICRRFGPTAAMVQRVNPLTQQPAVEVVGIWPAVTPDAWCGEHKPVEYERKRGGGVNTHGSSGHPRQ